MKECSVGTLSAGIPATGMTRGKHNENDNEDCSVSKNFRDDPFRSCRKPGGIDACVRASERSALIDVGNC